LFEAALAPGVVIGGAAVVLAPRYLPKGPLHKLHRSVQTLAGKAVQQQTAAEAPRLPRPPAGGPRSILPKVAIGQAVAKTITFRIVVTSLDFTTNYLVIGEVGTAAGLSTFNLIAGPLFYLAHEAVWNYFGSSRKAIELSALTAGARQADAQPGSLSGFTISRALAKTITFRVIASTMDQLLRSARRRLGAHPVLLRLHPRPVRLLRPREGVGLFHRAEQQRGLPGAPVGPRTSLISPKYFPRWARHDRHDPENAAWT
jgi:uncharacterized membrane protein